MHTKDGATNFNGCLKKIPYSYEFFSPNLFVSRVAEELQVPIIFEN